MLNAGDLPNMLATGNLEVTTTGSGVQANDIGVRAPISWSSNSTLDLDALRSITVDKPISISGRAGLSLVTNHGGSGGFLLFGANGNVTFASLASAVAINGTSYTLDNSLSSLAAAIAANPSGAFALANS